jgi:DNA-directed RNA polymerase beta' subunit
MERDTREIDDITFGIYSAKEILDMAVCKIDSPKKSGPNTVYDDRMGTTDSTKICETCKEGAYTCQGHFGYIELNEPVIHPLYYKRVVAFLNCFCLKCYRLLLVKDQISLSGLSRYKGEARFIRIQERLKKVNICCHPDCGAEHPRCKFSTTDSSIFKVYEGRDKVRTSIMLTTEEIRKIFDNIIDNDIRLIGLDPDLVHPRNLIITVLPVIPPCDRPYVQADGNMCDDDITNQYCEIIKANNHLETFNSSSGKKKELSETKRQKFIASLRFRILTTFNNGQGKAKHTTNGRAIKGIKERLAGKDGQLRNNMMG